MFNRPRTPRARHILTASRPPTFSTTLRPLGRGRKRAPSLPFPLTRIPPGCHKAATTYTQKCQYKIHPACMYLPRWTDAVPPSCVLRESQTQARRSPRKHLRRKTCVQAVVVYSSWFPMSRAGCEHFTRFVCRSCLKTGCVELQVYFVSRARSEYFSGCLKTRCVR